MAHRPAVSGLGVDPARVGGVQGRSVECLEWLKNTYPFIINDENDLKLMLDERMPPLPTHEQVMNGIAASLEEIVSNQVSARILGW